MEEIKNQIREKNKVLNKKASAGVIVVVIITILLIGGFVTLFIVLNQRGYFNPKPEEDLKNQISAIIKIQDEKTGEQVRANYLIHDQNLTIINQGEVEKDESREIKISILNSYTTLCWAEDYYLSKMHESITQDEINYNVTMFGCPVSKIEQNPAITHSGEINNEVSEIILNISVKDELKKVRIAVGWTSGFLRVYLKDSFIECKLGSWINYSSYDATTLIYEYLPEGQYKCGEEIESCVLIYGNKCKPSEEILPLRLKATHDDTFSLGKNILNETISIPFIVEKSEYATRNDKIWFTIYDMDRRFDTSSPLGSTWYSEYNNVDFGAEDMKYEIFYGGQT